MVYLCIDDDFSKAENKLIRKLFEERRDEFFPKKGLTYETKSTFMDNEKIAYQFKELPSAKDILGFELYFLAERFECLHIFKPDYTGENGYGVREETIVVNLTLPKKLINSESDVIKSTTFIYKRLNNTE